jgi:hypothetical protein
VVDISADYRYSTQCGVCRGLQARPRRAEPAVAVHLRGAGAPGLRAHAARRASGLLRHAAILLASVPLLKLGIATPTLFVSGVTGSTGSGRKPIEGTHHPTRHSDLYSYNALAHRHAPEVRSRARRPRAGVDAHFAFVPHSGPFARGIHVTVQAVLAKPASTADRARTVQAVLRPLALRQRQRHRAARQGNRRQQLRPALARQRRQDRRRDERARQPQQGRCRRRGSVDEPSAGIARNRWIDSPLDLQDGPQGEHGPHFTTSTPWSQSRLFAQYDLPVVRGEGVWLYTSDGRRVLDLYGGHAVAALGYGHPSWSKAVADQALNMNFQSNAVPMDVRLRAARKLVAFSKLPVKSVFFINSGAEANENALKMAFTLNPGRTEVIALEQSFHGRTAAAGALTWGAAKKWYGFPRTPFDVKFLPRRDPLRWRRSRTKTAAVVVEPIQGVGGAFDLGARLPQGAAQALR